VAAACVVAVVSTRGVQAHPSDASTLTLDLMFGLTGLEHVDAAMQRASYDQRPSELQRRDAAGQVLTALGVPRGRAVVAAGSDRYHEVGFTITLAPPLDATRGREVRVGSAGLQSLAGANDQRLKLEICPLIDLDPPLNLRIRADRPGRAPDPRAGERERCEIWTFGATDPPVTITVTSETAASRPVDSGARTKRFPFVSVATSALAVLAAGAWRLLRHRKNWAD
jgi:hypothetical protein